MARALLTDTERRALAGEHERDESEYEAASRVRRRLRDELPQDLETLATHRPELFAQLRDAVLEADQGSRRDRGDAPDDVGTVDDVQEASDEPDPAPTEPAPVDVDAEADASGERAGADVAWRELDLPGSGGTLEQRQDAVRELYEYLQHEGESTASKLRDLVWAQTGYASARSAWKNCLMDGLKQVAEQDDRLHAPAEGEHRWRYVEE